MTFDKELGNINQDTENSIFCFTMVTGTNIPDDVVSGFSEINLPNSITELNATFGGCVNLEKVKIADGVTTIGVGVFVYCLKMKEIIIPNSVTSIGIGAFSDCTSLTSVTIPNSVTSIENYAFEYCTSLTSVTIPNSVTSIGYRALGGCTRLTSVKVEATTPPSAGFNMFYYCIDLTEILVPSASVDAYKAASGWSTYANIIKGH